MVFGASFSCIICSIGGGINAFEMYLGLTQLHIYSEVISVAARYYCLFHRTRVGCRILSHVQPMKDFDCVETNLDLCCPLAVGAPTMSG